jgi:Domain of unknown function (DUF4760)
MNPSEISLAHATWALVAITFVLVVVTFWMAWRQSEAMRTDLRARFLLTFIDRFDGSRLLKARKELAHRLLTNASRDQIEETVLNFFEDMGLFLRRGYLDEELIWSTFGFFAVRWWSGSKGYILEERRKQNDSTLFTDFEDLTKRFSARDVRADLTETTPSDLKQFLEDERDL